MTIRNRINIDQLEDMQVGDVADLPLEQLALLQEDLSAAAATLKARKATFDAALAKRLDSIVTSARRAAGKDTGTIRIKEPAVDVVADRPKKVEWDQAKLSDALDKIEAMEPGEGRRLAKVTVEVPEAKFAAAPAKIKALLEPARTVSAGKQTIKLVVREGE